MKSNKAIDKTSELSSKINNEIFNIIDEVIDWEKNPNKAAKLLFIGDLKIQISRLVQKELFNAELFEYEGNYPKKKTDIKNLTKYKRKVSKLLKVDSTLSISAIAKELGISRQAIYKNKELKKYIDEKR